MDLADIREQLRPLATRSKELSISLGHDLNRVMRALQSPARRIWRRSLLQSASDITTCSATRSCLVLAPHPDDETLGCGATIARKRAAGTVVHIIVACNGGRSHHSSVISSDDLAAIRADEVRAASRVLGVPDENVDFLNFGDDELERHRTAVSDAILETAGRLGVDEVLAPSRLDGHPDHRALWRAVRDLRRSGRLTCDVLEYPVWSWVRGPWFSMEGTARQRTWRLIADPVAALHLRLAPHVVASGEFLEIKRKALAMHRSQTTNLTGEPDWGYFGEAFLKHFLGPYELFLQEKV